MSTRHNQDTFITLFVRGAERYIVVWRADEPEQAMQVVGRWAANPDLAFDWYDAAKLAARIRGTVQSEGSVA